MEFSIEFYETGSEIRSKAKKISSKDRKVALDRKRDWLERNPV